jgi:hypothetical protein
MQTIDDEDEHLQGLRQANALFTYAESALCTCAQCALCFIDKQTNNLTNPVTNNRVEICKINPSLYRGKQSTCVQIETTHYEELNQSYTSIIIILLILCKCQYLEMLHSIAMVAW